METERVFDINGALGVVREFLFRVFVQAQVFGINAQVDVPLETLVDPLLMPLLISARFYEELKLHLLEFAGTEDEVTWRDFVAEGLADLSDSERWFLAGGRHNVGELREDTLCCFGAQVVQSGLVINGTKECLEQSGESLGLCPLTARPTVRTRHVFHRHVAFIFRMLLSVLLD